MKTEFQKLNEQAKQAIKTEDWDGLLEIANQMFAVEDLDNQDKALAFFYLGFAYYEKSEYDPAIADYSKAIELDPKNAKVFNNRGVAYNKKGEYDKAIADFTKAIELNPKDDNVFNNRGVAYSKKGEYDKAIADYDEAIKIDSKNVNAFFNRGLAYYEKGEYDKAIADYDEAIKIDSKNVNAFFNRGLAYYEKGEYDKAIADYDKAIELNPKDVKAFNNRGLAYSETGEYDKAIADYDEAIKIDPKYTSAIHNRGVALALKETEKIQKEAQTRREELEKQKQELEEIKKQQQEIQEERDRQEKEISQLKEDFWNSKEYKEREKKYDDKFINLGERKEERVKKLSYLSFGVAIIILGIGGFAFFKNEKLELFGLLPLTILGITVLAPFWWNLHTINRDRTKYWALREDAFTKKLLAMMLNTDKNINKKLATRPLFFRFFDHHDRHSSAELILDHKAKVDNNTGTAENLRGIRDTMPHRDDN